MCVLIYLRIFSRGSICGATPLSKVSKPLSDGKITVWEAWLYPALYVIYIFLCTYWKAIEAKIHGGNPLHGVNKMPRIIWAIYSSIFGPITVFESLGFGTAYALTTIMIATFALFVILSATNAWVVTHPHAWIYLAIYAAFVVYVILDAIPGIVPGPASR